MTTMRSDLQRIAHRAMLERGLVPEFSPAEMAEARGLDRGIGPARPDNRAICARCCGRRSTTTTRAISISSRSPRRSARRRTRILVAIADVDAKVKQGSALDHHARTNTTSVYTDARIFPMLPELLSTDLTSLNEGEERLALVIEMHGRRRRPGARRGELYPRGGRQPRQARLQRVAAWLEGTSDPPRQGRRPSRGWPTTCGCRIASRRRSGGGATSTARSSWRRWSRAPCSTATRCRTCGSSSANRAKELIEDFMVAANVTTARFLEEKGFPSVRRVLRSPERWERIVELAATHGTQLPGAARRARAGGVPRRAPPGRSRALSRSVARGGQAARPRRVRRRDARPAARPSTSGSPCATTPTRPRRTAASPISSPSAWSRRRCADQPPPYTARRARRARRALHGRRGRRGQGGAAGAKVGRRAPSCTRGSARRSTRSSPALRRRGPGSACCARPSRGASCAGSRGSTSAIG